MSDVEIEQTLRRVHEVLLKFPLAAQAAFSALVAEGRAHARTAEGSQLLAQLTHSGRAHRVRALWEVLTLSGITDERSDVVPSIFLDKLARTLSVEVLEPVLARLFERAR